MASTPALKTTKEAAIVLRTSDAMVRRLIRRGDLRGTRLRGRYFVDEADLIKHIEAGVVEQDVA